MRKTLLIALATVALVATFVTPAAGITNGTPDGDNHPYVGLAVFDVGGGPAWRCSVSLLSPTLVLTAGHCTDGADAARVWFDEVVEGNPEYPFGGATSFEGTPYTHPDYGSPDNPFGGGNGLPAFSYRDVGVIVLSEPVPTSVVDEYVELPDVGLVDTLNNKTAIDFVGYGVQYQEKIKGSELPQPPPYYRWDGPKERMYAPSALVSGKFVHSAEYMKLALNPGGVSGGTCFGDSGGPDLLGGTDTVLAVNSYVTNINCSGVGYSSRVDIPEVLEWINSLEPEMVLDGYSSGPYNGTTLTVEVTVYEHPNGSYIGLGEYTYGTVSWPLTVADACVNETAKTATAWGPADAGYYGMLSLHDAGTGMMARAGHRGTMTELQPYIDTQCGGTPLFPATGTGYLDFG